MIYFIPFIISLLISLGLTPLIRYYVIKNKLALADPRERDIHKKPIPRLGGVAIFLSFIIVIIGYLIIKPDSLIFLVDSKEKFLGLDRNLFGLILGSLLLVIVGVVDDIRGMNPWMKLFWQIVSSFIITYFGIHITHFANPFGGLEIELGNWTYFFATIWIVLIVNVMNWLDGVDGLVSGISPIALIILSSLSIRMGQPATALITIILAGSTLGFLPYNFNPAKMFLGDSGSMFLGLMIAVAAIISGGKIATVGLVLGIPILDALWVILRRIFTGKSIVQADKFHLHHRFLEAGFSQKQTVVIFYIISALFGIVALQNGTHGKVIASLWLVLIMIIMGIGLIILRKRKNV
jgi:UDP-GlcNAc:undecaprenyl-phosphate/decaprenyl-phosphate GlcNAc-1-phosphate transferase